MLWAPSGMIQSCLMSKSWIHTNIYHGVPPFPFLIQTLPPFPLSLPSHPFVLFPTFPFLSSLLYTLLLVYPPSSSLSTAYPSSSLSLISYYLFPSLPSLFPLLLTKSLPCPIPFLHYPSSISLQFRFSPILYYRPTLHKCHEESAKSLPNDLDAV